MNSLLMSILGLLCILGCHGLSQAPQQTAEYSEESAESQKEQVGPVEIIAHRGASYDAPENTLASVKLAWEQNADAVEIDIWLTSDNQIVLMHDKTPKRYGGPDVLVSKLSLEQLRSFDVGAWKDPRWKGEQAPLIGDVLQLIPEGKRLFIEIKCGPEVLPLLQDAIEKSKIPAERVVLIGFSDETMKLASERFPQLETYWIVSIKKDKLTGRPTKSTESLLKTYSELGVTGLDLGGDTSLLTASYLSDIRKRKIPWYVWTVNTPSEARRLAQLGALGITTDRPQFLREGMLENPSE